MKFVRSFLSFFTTITTAIVFVVALNFISSEDILVSKYIMLQILGAGAITALVTCIGFSIDFKKAWHAVVASVIHYIVLCVIMTVLGVWFDWTEFSVSGVLSMAFYVAVVYVLVFVISYILMKKEADELNKALKERNKEE